MSIAVLKVRGKTVTVIVEKVREIILKLTGNLSFPTPNPTLVALTSQVNTLETAYQNAAYGGTNLKAIMRLELQTMLSQMMTLMGYVQTTSGGDAEKIISTGFLVKKAGSPVGILSSPGHVRVVLGKHPGELIVRWAGVKGRIDYHVEISPDPITTDSWTDAPHPNTGKVRLVVGGLDTGKMYWFRIFTRSTEGISGPSDAAGHVVL